MKNVATINGQRVSFADFLGETGTGEVEFGAERSRKGSLTASNFEECLLRTKN
jgi:hypothetical protein